jgi:multiple sugar transport system permease protein
MKVSNTKLARPAIIAVVTFWIIILLIPVIFTGATSLKFNRDIISGEFAFEPTSINFIRLFSGVRSNFLKLTINSLVTSSGTMVCVMLIAGLASYGLGQFRWNKYLNGMIMFWLLFVHLLPPIIFSGPLYFMSRNLGIYDTPFSVIIAHTLMNLPLGVWILLDGFKAIPYTLRESAMIEGASDMQIFSRIMLPLVKPALSASMILVFLFSWKDFLLALVLTSTPRAMTVPIGISSFVQEWQTEFGEMAAASLFAAIPAFLLVTVAQRYIIKGLTLGALKE